MAQPPSRQEADAQYQHRQRGNACNAKACALYKEQAQGIGTVAQGVVLPGAVGRSVHRFGSAGKQVGQQRAAIQHGNGADEPGYQAAQQAAAAHRCDKNHQIQQHGNIRLRQHQVARQHRCQRYGNRH